MKTKKAVIILLALQSILFVISSCSTQEPDKGQPGWITDPSYTTVPVSHDGVTFQIAELSKPENRLEMQSYTGVLEHLVNLSQREDKKKPSNIIAKSRLPDNMVNFGYHSFFDGMYHAFMDHRPVVLSPDVIWLLIS